MAELNTVARPYAEAAFAVAQDAKALPQWSRTLALAAATTRDARMKVALDDPGLADKQKETLLLSLLGDAPADLRSFIKVLVEAGRIELLPQISELFDARKDGAENVARAEIETAIALSDAQLAALKTSLSRHFGKTVETTVTVNPALIGGARITVGDRVIDGSVQGKLTAMSNQLTA